MTKCQNWYVVYTYPNSEKKIYNELTKRNITAFLPTIKEVRRWSDRNKTVEVPLFPNYVFVEVTPKEMWVVTLIARVVRFITFDAVSVVVKNTEIDLIKKLLSETNDVRPESFPVKGEKVLVEEGPFAGLVGRVTDKKGANRLYIELTSIHQAVSVDIDACNLGRLKESLHADAVQPPNLLPPDRPYANG